MSSRDAFRAAGQAVAALWHGVPICHVETDGIAVDCPDLPYCDWSRNELLGQIAIGLTGIVAAERYSFGWPPSYDHIYSWNFSDDQIADFAEVHAFSAAADPRGSDDVFFQAWLEALDFAGCHWAAIEAIAAALEHRPLKTGLISRTSGLRRFGPASWPKPALRVPLESLGLHRQAEAWRRRKQDRHWPLPAGG